MNSKNFYNSVASKFGEYRTGAKPTKQYSHGDPKVVFKENLVEASGTDRFALDIGCADGRFTLSMARYFQKITAIDNAEQMLKSAKKKAKRSKYQECFI